MTCGMCGDKGEYGAGRYVMRGRCATKVRSRAKLDGAVWSGVVRRSVRGCTFGAAGVRGGANGGRCWQVCDEKARNAWELATVVASC